MSINILPKDIFEENVDSNDWNALSYEQYCRCLTDDFKKKNGTIKVIKEKENIYKDILKKYYKNVTVKDTDSFINDEIARLKKYYQDNSDLHERYTQEEYYSGYIQSLKDRLIDYVLLDFN